jgi:hypothetical protein
MPGHDEKRHSASRHQAGIAAGMVKRPEVLVSQALAGSSRHQH